MNHTREDIVRAFNSLIAVHDLEDITVVTIAEEAGVGRATFYRYFRDKYDVMNYNYKAMLDLNLQHRNCTGYRELFYNLFREGQAELANVRRVFNSTGINSFENYIYTYSMGVVEEITRQNRKGDGFTETEQLQMDVFCRGVSYMYEKWVAGEYTISAKKASDALYDLMPSTLRDYWYTD